MKSNLMAALEELREDLYAVEAEATGAEGIENDMSMKYAFDEFEAYSRDYDGLVNAVSSLEQISILVEQTEHPQDKINYPAIIGFVNATTSSIAADDAPSLAISPDLLIVEGADKRAITLESIGSIISGIWNAIINFLERAWLWFKNLSIWQKLGIVKLNARVKNTDENIKQLEQTEKVFKEFTSSETFKKEAEEQKVNTVDDVMEILDAEVTKRTKKKFKPRGLYQDIVDIELRSVDEVMGDEVKAAKEKFSDQRFNASTESYNNSDLLLDSVFGVYEALKGKELCYNSHRVANLVTPEMSKKYFSSKKPVSLNEVIISVQAYSDFVNSYFGFVQSNYLNSIKQAIQVLTKDEFDANAAAKIISDIYPRSREARWANGSVKDDVFKLSEHALIGQTQVSFTFIDDGDYEEFLAAISAGKPIGRFIDKIHFMSGKLRFEENAPLIQLNKGVNSDTVSKITSKYSTDLFKVFEKTTEFSARYQNLLQGLIKAVERAARSNSQSNSQKAVFARAVMHSTNVYVNQPLSMINKAAPDIIEALCDYSDAFAVCHNPLSIRTLF